MPANPNREFLLELSGLVNKRVKISLNNEKIYTGVMRGVQDNSLNVVLADANCDNAVDWDEINQAISDWLSGVFNWNEINQIIMAWLS